MRFASMTPIRVVLFVLVTLGGVFSASCGGGGGGGSVPPPPPQSQSIAFTSPGPIDKITGDPTFTNAATGGAGSGAITYVSDAPAIATVDTASGAVTIVAAGIAHVTASKAADSRYLAATASYTIEVAPKSVSVVAWIGASDTQASLQVLPLSVNFVRATDLACDPLTFATCAGGSSLSTTGGPVSDPTTTLTNPEGYWLTFGGRATSAIAVPEQRFAVQAGPGTVVWNGRLWVVTDPAPNEVWSSADGVNWRLEARSPAFAPRSRFRLVVFNNALWLIGGTSGNTYTSDVFQTVDGQTWTYVTPLAGFPGRDGFAIAAFNGKLWLVGGWDGTNYLNDVWSSTDGATWTKATAAAETYGQTEHDLIAFQGKLWITGGFVGGIKSEIWSSPDGVTWSLATASAAFGPRFDQRVVTDGTTLWLVAGRDGYQSARNDVWSSTDGVNWTQVTPAAEFPVRALQGTAFFKGSLWVVGGTGTIGPSNAVWSSPTGALWTQQTLSARIPATSAMTATGFLGKIWALDPDMHLWSSADGVSWALAVASMPTSSGTPQLFALSDRLLLIGGWQYTAPNYYREVWQSLDGTTWTRSSTSVPFDSFSIAQALVANGKLWVFGGSLADPTVQEVWSTSDGANWTRVATKMPYSPRVGYSVVILNNHFVLVGGSSPTTGGLTDAWTSPDGVVWTQGQTTGLPGKNYVQAFSTGSSACLYDQSPGVSGAHNNWCSADGLTWTARANSPPLGPIAAIGGFYYTIGNGASDPSATNLVWRSSDAMDWHLGYSNSMTFQ